jgi:hypothetical protein
MTYLLVSGASGDCAGANGIYVRTTYNESQFWVQSGKDLLVDDYFTIWRYSQDPADVFWYFDTSNGSHFWQKFFAGTEPIGDYVDAYGFGCGNTPHVEWYYP